MPPGVRVGEKFDARWAMSNFDDGSSYDVHRQGHVFEVGLAAKSRTGMPFANPINSSWPHSSPTPSVVVPDLHRTDRAARESDHALGMKSRKQNSGPEFRVFFFEPTHDSQPARTSRERLSCLPTASPAISKPPPTEAPPKPSPRGHHRHRRPASWRCRLVLRVLQARFTSRPISWPAHRPEKNCWRFCVHDPA